jgi:hypothetical protein
MRKSIFAFVLLLMLVAATAWAGFSGRRDFYSDAAMTNQTGSAIVNCSGTETFTWGTSSTYRRFEGLHCETANDVILCHRWNGSGWVMMACPF